MADEIINRVAKSKLVTIDLEDHYPKGERILLDIKDWLYEGLILREKDFREQVKAHDWSGYRDKFVAVTCSAEAIIPSWAFLLIGVSLAPYAKKSVVGDLELLENMIFEEVIRNLSAKDYKDLPVIIKGCSEKNIPQTAYNLLIEKLLPEVRSLMYGEACSNVPLYKK